jgi:hypothetical protein
LRGVNVKARALAQIIAVIVGHIIATRAGVGGDDRDAKLGSDTLRASFLDEILVGAGVRLDRK